VSIKEVIVPDVGGGDVDVIELLVSVGDTVEVDEGLATLESDKASMDVPAPFAGVVTEFFIKEGDKIGEGTLVAKIDVAGSASDVASESAPAPAAEAAPVAATPPAAPKPASPKSAPAAASSNSSFVDSLYAGPAVRRIAREFGVDLTQISGTGDKNRITKADVQQFVQQRLSQGGSSSGLNVAAAPVVDFSKFGEIEIQPLSKINKLTGEFLHRNWVSIPHVTQFDSADITDMEAFRQAQKAKGVKLTPIVFVMKAVVAALKAYPRFNASLDASGTNLVFKKYFNVGVAVDTPNGLVVPVIRDVANKGLLELAEELGAIGKKAREKGLSPTEMQGSCIAISSLGGIGGTAFTPIVNAPDVAILGLSKSSMQPVWNGKEFVPRLMLPLSLSYDHRVIDGAEAARFVTFLSGALQDAWQVMI
jgi:pyruvate dehydrogenase E2 component (dihydrolipoamide acetyltransferase)